MIEGRAIPRCGILLIIIILGPLLDFFTVVAHVSGGDPPSM